MASLAIDTVYERPSADLYSMLKTYLITDRQFRRPEPSKVKIDLGLRAGLCVESSTPDLPAGMQAAATRLRELEALGRGWDSHGGRPLSDAAVKPALELIVDSFKACDYPRIHLNGRGGLDLFWDNASRSLDISVEPTGLCTVYYEDRETGDEVALDDPVPLNDARAVVRRYCRRG